MKTHEDTWSSCFISLLGGMIAVVWGVLPSDLDPLMLVVVAVYNGSLWVEVN